MSNREFVLDVLRLLKPEFYNKVTWSLVITGIFMLSNPLWLDILVSLINEKNNTNIAIEINPMLGLALIIIALIYNYFFNQHKVLQASCNNQILDQLSSFYNCKMYLLNNYYRPSKEQVSIFNDLYSKLTTQMISKYSNLEDEFELLATYSLPSDQTESGRCMVDRKGGIDEFDKKYRQFIRKIK